MKATSLHRTGWIAGLAGLVFLSACAERQVILPGVREDLRAVLSTGVEEPRTGQAENQSLPRSIVPNGASGRTPLVSARKTQPSRPVRNWHGPPISARVMPSVSASSRTP